MLILLRLLPTSRLRQLRLPLLVSLPHLSLLFLLRFLLLLLLLLLQHRLQLPLIARITIV